MYSEMIEGITPEIVAKELILDGTNSNYRTTRLRYFTDDLVVDEVFEYQHNAHHPAWGAIKNHYFEEANIETLQSFREWNISNHPTQKTVTRKLYLVELKINTKEIRVTVVMKHFRSNGYKADIQDKVFIRTGNDGVTYQHEGRTVTEREYWDILTQQYQLTPYQLLDMRIPEMDSYGIFNNY